MTRVGVFGSRGRMGAEVCRAVERSPDLELVAAIDLGDDRTPAEAAQVIVDFTHPDAVMDNLSWCVDHGVHAVVGTTGFTEERLDQLRAMLADHDGVGVLVAPNFSVGAVLMMHFAEQAAAFYESAEIIELHHDQKIDAPSGTAVRTAQRIAAASKDWGDDPTTEFVAEGARGGLVEGVPVHALRVRGMVASQEVLLGTTGQTLSIRHDTYDRSSFMPGVLLAVHKVAEIPGLTIGLDALLGL